VKIGEGEVTKTMRDHASYAWPKIGFHALFDAHWSTSAENLDD